MKKRKVIIISIIVLAALLIGGVCTFTYIKHKDNKGSNNTNGTTSKEENKNYETYTMYVKINPLVKLTYKVEYFKCKDDNGKEHICGGANSEVIDYELVNNDAKDIYNNIDFNGKDLYDVLITLCDTARDNNIGFEKLEITTDDSNIKMEEVSKAIKEKSKYENTIDVYVDFKEHIDTKELIGDEEISKLIVKFDTDGGNNIDNQTVEKNAKVTKPADPTKSGYTFKEWQLDGKKFDFNTAVNKDITLKAKWEKNKEKEENQTSNTPSPSPSPSTEPSVTPSPSPTQESKIKSTLNRINLNDNILVQDWNTAGMFCGTYYMFADNVEQIIPAKYLHNTNGQKYIELWDEETDEYYQIPQDQIQYNVAAENAAVNKANSLTLPIGITNLRVDADNHKIKYIYSRLMLDGDYENFGKEYNSAQNAFGNNLNGVFSNAWLVRVGGCGDAVEPKLLNEDLCNKYHLTCDRW